MTWRIVIYTPIKFPRQKSAVELMSRDLTLSGAMDVTLRSLSRGELMSRDLAPRDLYTYSVSTPNLAGEST